MACSGRGKHQAVARTRQTQLKDEAGPGGEDGVALFRGQGQGAEPAVFAGQAGGEGAGQGQACAAGWSEPTVAAEHGTAGQMDKAGSRGGAGAVAEQQGASLHCGAATVAAGDVQPHAAGAVEGEAVGARDGHLQVQQGTGRGFEAVVGPQGQGQATIGAAKNHMAGGVRQGQATVQGQGARDAAATAIGIHVKHLRQATERSVKTDAAGRAIAAQAHLRQQGAAAIAAVKAQIGARRLGRQQVTLPVGGAVPGGAEPADATIPDSRCRRAGGEAEQKKAAAERTAP